MRSPTVPWLRLFGFPSEENEETENESNNFSAVEDFTLLWWHPGTQKHAGRAKQNRPNRRRSRTFGSIVKTKHQSLTSLAFMWLAPGADRVVRHICIRCIRSIERTDLHSKLAHITPCVKIVPVALRLIGCIYNTKIGTALQYFIIKNKHTRYCNKETGNRTAISTV